MGLTEEEEDELKRLQLAKLRREEAEMLKRQQVALRRKDLALRRKDRWRRWRQEAWMWFVALLPHLLYAVFLAAVLLLLLP